MLYILDLLEAIIPNLNEWVATIGILILLCGIAEAFFGYRLFDLVLGIIGFFTGAAIGVVIFLSSGNGYTNGEAIRIYVLVGGIIGAALARSFHKLGIFLAVGTMGMFIMFLITQNEPISLALGIICGIAGTVIEEYIIIVTTALAGGRLAAMGIWFIGLADGKNKKVQLLGWMIGICGMIFQLWIEKIKPVRTTDDGGSVAIGRDELLHIGAGVAHFLGKLLHYFMENPKEALHNLIFKKDSEEINPVLPVVTGIILAALFRSMLFGIGAAVLLYVILVLLYIRKHGTETEHTEAESEVGIDKDALRSGERGKVFFCRACGSQLPENASFCQKCGEKIYCEKE